VSTTTLSWFQHSSAKTEDWYARPQRRIANEYCPERSKKPETPTRLKYSSGRCGPKGCFAPAPSVVVPEVPVGQRFRELADKWSEETGHVSSINDRISNPEYREIVKLGWEVVPNLLADLERTHRFWFPALTEITGLRPFDQSDAGNLRRMTEAWIRWGKKKGLI
jgi:hypothetical protein